MKTTVLITKMADASEEKKEFATENQAKQFFKEWCNTHGYGYDENSEEAGGIGHDFRIELA